MDMSDADKAKPVDSVLPKEIIIYKKVKSLGRNF